MTACDLGFPEDGHRGARGGAGTGTAAARAAERVAALWMLAIAVCASLSAQAAVTPPGAVDACAVIVTGADMRSRAPGMARCFLQVLVKVSGDTSVTLDPRAEAIGARAGDFVEDFAYFDRMSDVPMHDEQGSRDRPFDLVVHFDPAMVDRALVALDRQPWRTARPVLIVGVAVKDRLGGEYTLSADGNAGERQRESLFAAGELYGIRVALPPESALAPGSAADPQRLARMGNAIHSRGSVPLTGSLRWSEPDFGWVATWTLTLDDRVTSWEIRGVSFDEAFRSGIGAAAGVLAKAAAR
jgi:hypothetical protein